MNPRERLIKIGIFPKYMTSVLMDFNSILVRKKIRKYIFSASKMLSTGTGLFIHGPEISGKSLLANVVALALDASGFSVRITNLDVLVRSKFEEDGFFLQRCESTVEFLIVDDVGKSIRPGDIYVNEGHRQVFYDLVRHRDQNNLPLIVTSRMTLQTTHGKEAFMCLGTHFGDSVVEILKHRTAQIFCQRKT